MSYSFWKLELIIIFIINWTQKKENLCLTHPQSGTQLDSCLFSSFCVLTAHSWMNAASQRVCADTTLCRQNSLRHVFQQVSGSCRWRISGRNCKTRRCTEKLWNNGNVGWEDSFVNATFFIIIQHRNDTTLKFASCLSVASGWRLLGEISCKNQQVARIICSLYEPGLQTLSK